MKMKTIIAAFAAIAASAAFADKVTLASGSSLTGATGVIRDGKVTFVSDDLGEIQIPLDKIALLESDKDHVVAYLDGTEATKKVAVKDGALVEGGKKLDMAKVKAVDPIVETWHGSFNVSATATRGNDTGRRLAPLGEGPLHRGHRLLLQPERRLQGDEAEDRQPFRAAGPGRPLLAAEALHLRERQVRIRPHHGFGIPRPHRRRPWLPVV